MSNCKVTRLKILSILTQIGRFRTIGRSQLSNPSDLPCYVQFIYRCLSCVEIIFHDVNYTGVLVAWKSFFIMSIFYVQFIYCCLSCVEIIFHNVNFLCTVHWCLSCVEIIFHNVNFICTV